MAALDGRVSLHLLLLLLLCLSSLSWFGVQAQKLDPKEVTSLRAIATKLKIRSWDFNVNPCSGNTAWLSYMSDSITSNLTCGDCNTTSNTCSTCNATSAICNVISIQLKGQNLTGVLPDEFTYLTYLSVLDLSRNYINGTIPKSWASLRLTQLSLSGNRLSGLIPNELGEIATLQSLVLEANQLQGPVPASLGKLTNLTRLLISSNNFSGELPDSLGNLKNMQDFRIDGNPISGKIPGFIGNWIKLDRLDMQGTLLEGPFPQNFTSLQSITELRVTDLRRGDGNFPPLQNMVGMEKLVLRNLSISGHLPDFLGNMAKLKTLDLSFNNLSGPIPSSFDELEESIDFMYLTNNRLSGAIPNWIRNSKKNLDLSYNTFTDVSSAPPTCQQSYVNFVSSFSTDRNSIAATCLLKGLPCSGKAKNYNVFINCGGEKVTVGDDEYEDDTSRLGGSNYVLSGGGKWAYSSTGDFIGNEKANYIATNVSLLNMSNPNLYTNGRLSPISLRYYGLCLQNGEYTVKLHFAEIMFTDDETFASVGKRIFDVSIQGQKVLQDFNIAKEANGTAKEIIKIFTAIVDANTLEIHLHWTGKGTNSIPFRSVYGPLISAISVTPNFKPDTGGGGLSLGVILGIAAAAFVVFILVIIFLWICLRRKDPENDELKGLELQTGYFTLKQIKAATRNFDPENKIGEGGFGSVYKGVLPDGSVIAVKQLSSKSKQGNREFVNEIGMISPVQHPNLVRLFGCCVEGNQLLLIYEYMENNSLARALFGPENTRLKLDWQARRKICIGIARGLAFLHEESRLKIVHRDIKATNILLDRDLNAKISDFGLAKLNEDDNTHISTRIAGTIGYMAPEYAMRGYLTDKADVYSFGIVMLEIVSGTSNKDYMPKEDFVYLLDWAYVLQEKGDVLDLVDPNLGSNYTKEEALRMLKLALLCSSPSPSLRPKMSSVVSMLEGKTPFKAPSMSSDRVSYTEDAMFKSLKGFSHDSHSHSMSIDCPWIDSSMSSLSSNDRPARNPETSKLLVDYSS